MKIINDFNTTMRKALDEIDPNWEKLPGLIICGTHTPFDKDIGEQINLIKEARENGTPFLGVCFGHQLAAIEYCRNVMGIDDATSEEFGDPTATIVVYKLPKLNVGLHKVYDSGAGEHFESFWNNYEVMPDILARWVKPPHFLTCQYHPEYQSSKEKPHPLLTQFIELCKRK